MDEKTIRYFKKTGIFLGIFFVALCLLFLIQKFLSVTPLSITDVLLFIIIVLVVFLFVSGGISEFTWGSLSIKMQEITKEKIKIDSERIEIEIPNQIDKGSEEFLFKELPKIIKKNPHKPSVLIIKRKKGNYYGSGVLLEYLRTNFFDFAVFLDNQTFIAYISASKLSGVIQLNQIEIQNMINQWKVNDIPGIETESLNEPVTIKCLMDIFENKNLKDIAIVDKDRKFLSIVTKEEVFQQFVEKLSME
jgi:hypothetical protein